MSASAILIPMAISLIAAAVTPGKAKKQLAADALDGELADMYRNQNNNGMHR